ncbi:uncharacterized protein LACBIDRAFT_322576 [Laccaria bicolor S238N-H82]|uniref:Predicted protein n=1 Tax=Laccaria bicolor (strain S238N-H82 / ATCC MYA-4686) TaxID=486041 RepID=B0CWT0_LACBS|nr:uncharacterized protein LACBIDRAFT_322576 [Laccaria bicolor S238N-H82]EDR13559.1 predicted protein [Laccaria bicolor S238N-H82]|eukprot:XP_001876057.1 predicted protein [Laccaria bicolor S238N-H82]
MTLDFVNPTTTPSEEWIARGYALCASLPSAGRGATLRGPQAACASSSGPSFLRDLLCGLENLDIFNAASLPKITHLHLRTFSVSTIGNEGLCKILGLARSLQVFDADSLEPHSNYEPPTVIHSNLQHLVLKEVDSIVLNDLLGKPYISTPHLEDLTIEIYYGSPDSTSLYNFITSFHQLQWFRVKYGGQKDPDWI